MGPGGRAVEPERAPEPPWRALLESRSLPKEPLGHSPERNQALATSSRPPASLHGLRVFLTLEADSDRLLATKRPTPPPSSAGCGLWWPATVPSVCGISRKIRTWSRMWWRGWCCSALHPAPTVAGSSKHGDFCDGSAISTRSVAPRNSRSGARWLSRICSGPSAGS